MVLQRTVVELGILIYSGAQMAAVHGLTDLFGVANRIAAEHQSGQLPVLRLSHWQADADGPPTRVFDSLPGADQSLVALLIPPSIAGFSEGQARYPAITLEADKPIVDDGDLITTAGLMAWSELGLRVVDRLLGPSIAASTARFLVIEHSDSASECGSNFAPILSHGDAAILKVQHWLQASGAVDVSLAAMAQAAGLEERTFLRRFRSATGLKPTEYCQHLRVGKARQVLEFTNDTIDHIAWTVGYQDPSAFRAIFKKITGLAPSDYRSRFGVSPAKAQA
jgi:transcriptional regulator GlxA family with amidase domain